MLCACNIEYAMVSFFAAALSAACGIAGSIEMPVFSRLRFLGSAWNTLCAAFDKQLDALFGDEALDISTDITVMENLLKQEGLSGDGQMTVGG